MNTKALADVRIECEEGRCAGDGLQMLVGSSVGNRGSSVDPLTGIRYPVGGFPGMDTLNEDSSVVTGKKNLKI